MINMFTRKEILFWVFALIIGIVLAWSCRLEAMDIQKLEEPVKKEEKELYPNFLLYNSTQSCMRGVIQMIIQYNPKLQNQMIPPAAQQQILGHCSCVMDNIRAKYPIQEYYNKMNDFLWVRDVWGSLGIKCMKAGYLLGLGVQYPKEDNETKDNKTESPKPEPKVEEELSDEPTIFQG